MDKKQKEALVLAMLEKGESYRDIMMEDQTMRTKKVFIHTMRRRCWTDLQLIL
jgi:hypothetical protein